MAFDIGVKTKTFSGNEDRRWLGTRMGADQCRSITLDVSAFLAAHFTDKGAIPSGTVLAKITATGLYGPYTTAGAGGLEVAAGLLFNTTPIGTVGDGSDFATASDVGAPLFWGPGIVKESYLPLNAGTTNGEIDAAGKADLPMIRWEA
jgi:hypothetical protein